MSDPEYIFHREGFFYIVPIPREMILKHGEEKCIADNAKCNPGTLKVTDVTGRVVWQLHSDS